MMRSKATLMALMAAGLLLNSDESQRVNNYNPTDNPTDGDLKKNKEDQERKYKQVLLKKGVLRFDIDGKTVYARNYKNALKKANRM